MKKDNLNQWQAYVLSRDEINKRAQSQRVQFCEENFSKKYLQIHRGHFWKIRIIIQHKSFGKQRRENSS